MVSSASLMPLYCVQVRFGNSYTEHVGSCESPDFLTVKRQAVQVLNWLTRGWCSDLPESVLDLPDDLRAQGFDPAAAAVEVVRLACVGEGRYDTRGEVMLLVIDCAPDDDEDDRELEDTTLHVECVSVPAQRRW